MVPPTEPSRPDAKPDPGRHPEDTAMSSEAPEPGGPISAGAPAGPPYGPPPAAGYSAYGQVPPPQPGMPYPPYPPAPTPPKKRGVLLTCTVVVLLAVFLLGSLAMVGAPFLGNRARRAVDSISAARKVSNDFVDAAKEGNVSKMLSLSDESVVEEWELEELADFLEQNCGQVRSVKNTSSGVESTGNLNEFTFEYRLSCTGNDVRLRVILHKNDSGQYKVVGASWQTD
jgi:hypothetical protein